MTNELIERVDNYNHDMIKCASIDDLLKDCKTELIAKDAEIERLKELAITYRDGGLGKFKQVMRLNKELNRIKNISVEDIENYLLDQGYLGSAIVKGKIGQAIHNLINGESDE